MYVNDSKDNAVLFVYKIENMMNQTLPRLYLDDLDGKHISGAVLMEADLEVPLNGDYTSRVFSLTKD